MTTPAPWAPPRRTSLVAPVTLTAVGVVLLLVASAVAVLVVRLFLGLLPLDVLDGDGDPGSGVLAVIGAPGSSTVVLDADTAYALYLLVPDEAAHVGLDSRPEVTAPDGSAVDVRDAAAVSLNASRGGMTASTVAAFTTGNAGTYTVAVPAASVDDARVLVVEDAEATRFLSGVLGTVAGVALLCVLAVAGLGATIGGAAWWASRVRARPSPATPAAPR
ncbi:hypothetical protein [Cellulomonas sp.]|uniref:hypothetical protein n=1 Tax=Cellulomonas sp. TaxID=40001 RepID=UPI001B174461|nr:hypothetical protein [Cellulomonas sp.]MBO9555258.1 hypothetical protein [Cellulomonas sp.]